MSSNAQPLHRRRIRIAPALPALERRLSRQIRDGLAAAEICAQEHPENCQADVHLARVAESVKWLQTIDLARDLVYRRRIGEFLKPL